MQHARSENSFFILAIACLCLPFATASSADEGLGRGSLTYLYIVSENGSACTVMRAGVTIASLDLEQRSDGGTMGGFVHFDTEPHRDVMVSCAHEGYRSASQTLEYGRVTGFVQYAPCGTSKTNASQQDLKRACESGPLSTEVKLQEYPRVVELKLERN